MLWYILWDLHYVQLCFLHPCTHVSRATSLSKAQSCAAKICLSALLKGFIPVSFQKKKKSHLQFAAVVMEIWKTNYYCLVRLKKLKNDTLMGALWGFWESLFMWSALWGGRVSEWLIKKKETAKNGSLCFVLKWENPLATPKIWSS